jgi:hypothetical protein
MEILKNNAGRLCPELFQTLVIDYIASRKLKWLQYCQNWLQYIVMVGKVSGNTWLS